MKPHPAKRKIVIVTLAVLVFAASLLCWRVYTTRGSGPFYKSRKLSVWLEGYKPWSGGAWQQSDEAVKALGTNALPTLLTLLRRGTNSNQISITDQDQTLYAIRACEALGPMATPAFPELTNCFSQAAYASCAPNALAALGAEGILVVISGLTNQSAYFQHCCAQTLEHVGPAGSNGVPGLLICLTNKDPMLRAQAARSLGCIGMYPELVVPALVTALHDKNTLVREDAIYGLGQLKSAARPAVPALLECLKEDTNGHVFFMARAWLHEIDPEAARKAGVKY
jgi:hypothetical protein